MQLLIRDIQFVCGGELILDEASQYFGKVKTNPAMTSHKVIESTFFKSLKFDAVCVTCASSVDVLGVHPLRRNARQQILLPQCHTCVTGNIAGVVCANVRKNTKLVSFQRKQTRRVQQTPSDAMQEIQLPELVVNVAGVHPSLNMKKNKWKWKVTPPIAVKMNQS